MMKIILLTILPNKVAEIFSHTPSCDLRLIDIDNKNLSKQTVLRRLEQQLAEGADYLFTYRCPIMIPAELYRKAEKGAYNIHPYLLPQYPGVNPWRDLLAHHEKESGITIHCLADAYDAGEVVCQSHFPIDEKIDSIKLREQSDVEAASLVSDFLMTINNMM